MSSWKIVSIWTGVLIRNQSFSVRDIYCRLPYSCGLQFQFPRKLDETEERRGFFPLGQLFAHLSLSRLPQLLVFNVNVLASTKETKPYFYIMVYANQNSFVVRDALDFHLHVLTVIIWTQEHWHWKPASGEDAKVKGARKVDRAGKSPSSPQFHPTSWGTETANRRNKVIDNKYHVPKTTDFVSVLPSR